MSNCQRAIIYSGNGLVMFGTTSTNIDQHLRMCRHMVWLVHNELTYTKKKWPFTEHMVLSEIHFRQFPTVLSIFYISFDAKECRM